MSKTDILSFVISSLAGFSTLIGFLLCVIFKKKKDSIIICSIAFSAAVMTTLSICDLIPQSINYFRGYFYIIPSVLICFIFVILGLLFGKILNKSTSINNNSSLYRVGLISCIAIIIHNIPEGIATFITSVNDISMGISLALSIAMHNIPEGISISLPIYYATNSKKKAFFYTLISALSEPFGAFLAYFFLAPFITSKIMGFLFSSLAGIMLYISYFELLREALSYNDRKKVIIFYLIGAIFVIINVFFIG